MSFTNEIRTFVMAHGGPNAFTPKQLADHFGYDRLKVKDVLKRLRREREIIGSDKETLDEVLDRKRLDFQRKKAQHHEELVIKMKTVEPIGLCFVGDPHLDDDGCDIEALEAHMEILNNTEGLYGFSVGDYTNNWTGRLARLYAEQHTTPDEILLLIEWFVTNVPWLALIGGNHDVWDRRSDLLKWITKQAGVPFRNHSIRIKLQFPNKREVRIAARHDFKGTSIWNKAHGVMRAGQKGLKDHIIIAGHRHTSAFGVQMDPWSGLIQHCQLVGGYKTVDEHQQAEGFDRHNWSPAHVTIIDPTKAEADPAHLQTFLSVTAGASYLDFLRRPPARGHRRGRQK